MTEKRFHYDWKTGRFKDTQSNSCATSNMRVLETQINNACFNYEKKIKKLEKENRTLKLLVQNWEQLDDEKDEQLKKMNDSLKRLVEENKQLQQELFESEYENICERYHDNPIRRESWVEDLKEEFKERFGREFEYE